MRLINIHAVCRQTTGLFYCNTICISRFTQLTLNQPQRRYTWLATCRLYASIHRQGRIYLTTTKYPSRKPEPAFYHCLRLHLVGNVYDFQGLGRNFFVFLKPPYRSKNDIFSIQMIPNQSLNLINYTFISPLQYRENMDKQPLSFLGRKKMLVLRYVFSLAIMNVPLRYFP